MRFGRNSGRSLALSSSHRVRDLRSLGRSDILRCRAVGISASKESGIAINAAERTDSECAQQIPLRGPAAMRSKYLGTPRNRDRAVWSQSSSFRT
jgi:hypothetical protein